MNMMSLCLSLLEARVSHPVSVYKRFIDTSLVAPVTIRAASTRIFSSSFASYCVQLSHTTSAYSKRGLMNEKLIICKDFLSKMNFIFLNIDSVLSLLFNM